MSDMSDGAWDLAVAGVTGHDLPGELALKWGNRPGCHWQAGGLPYFG